ncbi:hypothetical protein [Trinickia acidisoli]|uniref:hypothetical protein n=1 Tax=Trinickia acidisoli TaxID=2767482 RepID=UPI001A8C5D67|nr:hypothetical protein [Trinickia acidisoli]
MSRNKFLFAHSARLYEQSEGLATFLLNAFVDDDAPFRETAAVLAKAGALHLTDQVARKRAADLAWDHLRAVSGALDLRSVIPALLETIEQYYYGNERTKAAVGWMGTAMKTASVVVWANRGVVTASMKAQAQVRRLVAAAGAWEQLNIYDDQARALELGPAVFKPQGVELERDEDYVMREAWNANASKRGLGLRTLQDCMTVVWQSAGAFMEAVSEVLAGAKPSSVALFQGTVFEETQALPEFWLGLSARLQLMGHAALFRGQGRVNRVTGISIFEPFAFASRFYGSDAAKAEAASQAMFWQRDWHARRLSGRDYLSNMLVERPAIRIDDRTFVVAMTNIGDSINTFVEHSVFRCLGYGGVPVSEQAFRRYVSQPFEDRAIACFTDRTWRADHVSESGTWLGTKLSHPTGEPIPGEVDVLAMHPSGGVAILAECKVLSSPFNAGKLLNMAQKLGLVDSERFHSKLERKAKWLRETAAFKDVELVPLLLVDEGAFMGAKGHNLVVNFEDLPALVDACGRHVEALDQG